jgi:hypothetical protein
MSHIPNEFLNVTFAHFAHPSHTEERDDVVAEARHRVGFRSGLHGLALPDPALNEAAFLFIKVDEARNGQFAPLGCQVARRILAKFGRCQHFARRCASLRGAHGRIAA